MSAVTTVVQLANEAAIHIAAIAATKGDTEFDATTVSPGAEGFIATAAFAAAVIALGFLLVSRIRRNNYRHEVREEIAAELSGSPETDEASGTPSVDTDADKRDS